MKVLLFLSFTCLVGCALGRFPWAGVNPEKNNAWVASIKYLDLEGTRTDNDVVILAMGHRYPWEAGGTPPYWALAGARGPTSELKAVETWKKALGVVMSYNGLADFCETNGVPGIQWKHWAPSKNDRIIKFIPWQELKWNDLKVTDSWSPVLWGNLTSTQNEFSMMCRAGLTGKVDGITIGPYDVKCDVHVDAQKIWSMTPDDQCPPEKRYIAMWVFFGGVFMDVKGDGGDINKTDTENSGELDFGRGAWFKFKKVVNPSKNRLLSVPILPRIYPVVTDVSMPDTIKVIREASFTFMAPKSTNPGVLEWDPVFGLNPEEFTASSSTTMVSLALLLLCALFLN